jgi:UDP-3-O-[3-hydroxymyristoyl] glucosamine N-acyltransferase
MISKPDKSKTVAQIAEFIGATFEGDASTTVSGLGPLEFGRPNELCFIRDNNLARVTSAIAESKAAAFIVHESLHGQIKAEQPILFAAEPQQALVKLAALFDLLPPRLTGISPLASIDVTAIIAEGVAIGAFAVIGAAVKIGKNTVIHPHACIYPDVEIGADCTIHAGVVIREKCKLSNNCVIQPGSVIGADGFGYVPDPTLGLKAVPQLGNVEFEAHVDVGANACIDRAALGSTRVGIGSKLDNLVQVGHNVQIGKHSILCGQVGIAGSCVIGDRVMLGGQSGVADHIRIESDSRIAAQSGVITPLDGAGDFAGYPAIKARLWLRMMALLRHSVTKGNKKKTEN